jgi:chaperone BCS1
LLFGKPGCGKTSFAKAVAGQFGPNVYALSLLDKGLTDTELGKLFLTLKPKSLVLLEDIDSAGIGREYTKQADELNNENNSGLADAAAGGSGTKTGISNKTITGNPMQSRSQVTLSGLLNAIDGVVSLSQSHTC